jgi:thiamine transporter ThiT
VPVIVASTAAGLELGFIAVGGLLYGEITLLLGESYET